MPTVKTYVDESLLTTPNSPRDSFLEASFGTDLGTDWANWMQWDAGPIGTDPANSFRKDRFESTYSACDGSDLSPASAYSTRNDNFDNAPFSFDDMTDYSQFPITCQIPQEMPRYAQGCNTLTAAQQQSLEAIAMPYLLPSPAKLEPPSLTISAYTISRSPSLDPKPSTRKTKKRKSLIDDNEEPNAICQSKKRGHNAIEKRYRTNLNDKIACLRRGIPPLWRKTSTDSKSGDEAEDSDNETGERKTSQKYGKAAILSRALDYIKHLEGTTERLGDEVEGLKRRVEAFERLTMCNCAVASNSPLLPLSSTSIKHRPAFSKIMHNQSTAQLRPRKAKAED